MVLKRIAPSQVEQGMYIHAFQGNWFAHPFWRAHFVVEDAARCSELRASGLDAIVIDTDKGRDLPGDETAASSPAPVRPLRRPLVATPAPAPASPPAAVFPAPPARPSPRTASGPVPLTREFGSARRLAGKANKIISRVFLEARLGKAPRVADVAPVVEDIFASIQRNPYAFSGLMRCKAESEATYHHMLAVSALMVSLARQMRLPPGEMRLAGLAGLLLDVGLARVEADLPEVAQAVLSPARGEERELLGRHCLIGREMLASAGDVPEEVLQAVMRHHERLDGEGYPQALDTRDLDVFSRMAAICDSYDLIVSGAVTGRALDPSEAMETLMGLSGSLDTEILARFKEALGVYPVGSFVQLRSARIALVVDQCPGDPELPTVTAFYSLETNKHVRAKTIALAECYGEDAIVGVADLDALDLPSPEDLREALLSGRSRTDQIPYQKTSVVESAATMMSTSGTPERR
ncbi:HD-GYP domain-containing protein [Novosphingobium decolorationis]|uniref:DUF3391 domain-containing protein n=1 Tax=Novosphingobium decolorationis TaxID=2698673 RepID=A0ABX8E264_9SPHN|nr:HD-GYP domain-containing protein [Novosphingobium decolorationis]QVM83227.1 DUF3391 domain-containing protein [Novosphingobium decolorationis]